MELLLKTFKVRDLFVYGCAGVSLVWSFSLAVASGSYSLDVVHGLLIALASLVVEQGL